ncbi:MAG: hypothetical protein ACI4M9_08570, partial [Succinivibrio sp.]
MPQLTNRDYRKNSFEPRIAIVQLVFGIIYAFVTGVGVILAFKVLEASGQQPWLQYFFVVLFGILAAKSFYIFASTKIAQNTGVYTTATVDKITPTHGITIIEGQMDLKDGTTLPIESRFAGESVGHELQRLMTENKVKALPALLVNQNTRRPKGQFLVKTRAGHLTAE